MQFGQRVESVLAEAGAQLDCATDVGGVADALEDAAKRTIGMGGFNLVPFLPGVLDLSMAMHRSSEFSPEAMHRCLVGVMPLANRELGGVAALFASGPAFDIAHQFARGHVERTSTFNDYWRPYKVDRQLVAPMTSGSELLGFSCLARSGRERAFNDRDLRIVEVLRSRAGRALARLRSFGSADLTRTLEALAAGYSLPAFLFDSRGRLRWMSDEGTIRLSIESIRSGASRVVLGSASLELLSRAVRTLLAGRMGEGALENSLRRDGLLGSGERVVTRRFGVSEQEVLLISLEAMSTGPGRPALTVSQVVKKLGTMERRVALLAAEGYAVLNIAANLSISEATVRTHLRRAYFKLGVHNRAELACAILEMRAPRAD